MKPKITDFVNCYHFLCSLSHITLIEVTINQWCDDRLTCCHSVNCNTSFSSESLVYSAEVGANHFGWGSESDRGRTSLGANTPGGEQARGETAKKWKSHNWRGLPPTASPHKHRCSTGCLLDWARTGFQSRRRFWLIWSKINGQR